MEKLRSYILAVLLFFTIGASAQCTFRNTAFNSGEYLSYNLYYNWKFIWVKAGTAAWYTVSSNYNGIPAYRASLTTRGNNKVDNYFVLRDTLLCYNSKEMAPLYYRKGAREGKRYTVEEVFYTYPNGKCKVRQHRIGTDAKSYWKEYTSNECMYDMMSIFLRARSFNPESWKKGQAVYFPLVDGDSHDPAKIVFLGKKIIKADNNIKYNCLQLAYYEYEDNKWHKIASFFVTDDQNHIPVRLDMNLKFGTAKAFLTSMRGIRSKVTSEVARK